MHDFLEQTQRWINHYRDLPGRRVKIVTLYDSVPEVFWVLGQEQDYLVLGQEPYNGEPGKRRFTVLDTRQIRSCEVLEQGPAPGATAIPHQSEAPFDPSQLVFALGRVTVHAVTASGSRSHIEITGVEPIYGGYFLSSNHVLGFALNHLHLELQQKSLISQGDLPFRPSWWEFPTKAITAPLLVEPAASLTIYVMETWSDQLAGVTVPALGEAPSRAVGTPTRLKAWGYEALCREAVSRRLLPSDFKPKIRRNQLD